MSEVKLFSFTKICFKLLFQDIKVSFIRHFTHKPISFIFRFKTFQSYKCRYFFSPKQFCPKLNRHLIVTYCRRLPPVTELEFQQQLLAKMWLLGPYPFIKSKLKLFFKLFHCLCILLPCYFKNYPKGPYWDIFPITEPKMCLLFIYRQP